MKYFHSFFKNQIAVAILLASLILAGGLVAYSLISKNNSSSSKEALLNSILNQDKYFHGLPFQNNEYILGNPENKITLVVYSDTECPFCKMLHENVIQALQKEYGLNSQDYSQAKIGIVYRHFALSFHDRAPLEINAALCTRELYGQNAYLNFLDRIYAITPANNGLDPSLLPDIAKYATDLVKTNNQNLKKEFDSQAFQSCYQSGTYNAEFMADAKDALDAGLDGTPYSLILYRDNQEQLIVQKISGAQSLTYFKSALDKLLKLK